MYIPIKRLIISKINIDQRANITKAIDFILIKHCFQNTGQSNWLYFILIQTPSSKFSFSEKLTHHHQHIRLQSTIHTRSLDTC